MTRQPDTMQVDSMQRDPMQGETTQLATSPLETIPRQPDGHMVRTTLSYPQPDTTVCTVTGPVDLVTAPILTDTLTEAVLDDRSHLVIDLSAAALLDSAGLQAVFEALDKHEVDGHLAVVADLSSETIGSPEISALGELLDRHDDLASALLACASASITTAGRHRARVISRTRVPWRGSVI